MVSNTFHFSTHTNTCVYTISWMYQKINLTISPDLLAPCTCTCHVYATNLNKDECDKLYMSPITSYPPEKLILCRRYICIATHPYSLVFNPPTRGDALSPYVKGDDKGDKESLLPTMVFPSLSSTPQPTAPTLVFAESLKKKKQGAGYHRADTDSSKKSNQ
jgi:hypothetical protein